MKRKGTDTHIATETTTVVELLNNVKDLYERDDDVAMATQIREQVRSLRYQAVDVTLAQTQEIKAKIEARIDEDERLYKSHLEDKHNLEAKLASLREDIARGSMSADDLSREISEVEAKIQQHMAEAGQELERIDEVELARKNEVPRLKNFVKLYAMVTRIKWEFEAGSDVMNGVIAVPATNEIVRFSIDPNEYSDFEIANYFWDLMEGGSAKAVLQ
uniref:Kinetochore protein Spc24 n=1 Tax=Leptocylindrus danicus TaxID=163516 RepID=A0A7S2PTF7_9STRA